MFWFGKGNLRSGWGLGAEGRVGWGWECLRIELLLFWEWGWGLEGCVTWIMGEVGRCCLKACRDLRDGAHGFTE